MTHTAFLPLRTFMALELDATVIEVQLFLQLEKMGHLKTSLKSQSPAEDMHECIKQRTMYYIT